MSMNQEKIRDVIETICLKNGLKCYFRDIGFYGAFVTMSLTVKIGSMKEPVGKRGVAHLLEHMLMSFWTNKLYSNARLKAHATTNFSETIFFLKCSSEQKNLDKCINIIYDVAQGKYLDKIYFQRAKQDVLKEIKMGKNQLTVTKILLENSIYSDNYALGEEKDIINMTFDDVIEFFEENYSARNMSLALVGDLRKIHIIKQFIKKKFVNIKDFETNPFTLERYLLSLNHNCCYFISYKEKSNESNYINILIMIEKNIELTLEEKIKSEIIEKIVLKLITYTIRTHLDNEETNIECEYDELEGRYMFYKFRFEMQDEKKENVISKVNDIIKAFDYVISEKEVEEQLKTYTNIERDEMSYYRDMGMHQLLLECIDNYLYNGLLLNYEEKCILYEKMIKRIKFDDVEKVYKRIVNGDRIFVFEQMNTSI